MRTLFLLSALPGSGKSTWAEQYRRTHKNVYVISSDELRKELTGEYQNFEHEKEVWSLFLSRANDLAKEKEDVTVILDAVHLTNELRKYYHDMTPDFDCHILVMINKPFELVLKQNLMRAPGKIVPEDVIRRMRDNWEEPSEEILNLYDEIHIINRWFSSDRVPQKFYYEE